jgi:hypothetical protein
VFGPVWSALYPTIAWSGYRWRSCAATTNPPAQSRDVDTASDRTHY